MDYTDFAGTTDAQLRETLFGRDVLLVFDQGAGATAMRALGAAWHDRLRAFLDAGGVVVLLDGRRADDITPSETVALLSPPGMTGDPPLLDAAPFPGVLVSEPAINPDDAVSPLRADVGDTYDDQTNAVVIDHAGEGGQPVDVYTSNAACEGECFDGGGTVIDKIFPVYTIGVVAEVGPAGVACPDGNARMTITPGSGAGFPAGATFVCTLDPGSFQGPPPMSCQPGVPFAYTSPFGTGEHSLRIVATDAHGNPGRVGVSGFSVDNVVAFPGAAAALVTCSPQDMTCPHPADFTCDNFQGICGVFQCCQSAGAPTDRRR